MGAKTYATGQQLTGVCVCPADSSQSVKIVKCNALIRTNGSKQLTRGVNAERRGRSSVLGERRNFRTTLENLDGSLARGKDELASSPGRVENRLIDCNLAFNLLRFDRVYRRLSITGTNGSITTLEGKRGGLRKGC